MQDWTDRIATLSPPTVVLCLVALTAARVSLRATRVAVFLFLAEILESILLAAALVFLILRPFVVHSYHIPTGSMRPTLREGDHILVNKLVYRFARPDYGDALVFRAPADVDREQREFVKRLVGLPGDTIEVRPGFVQVGNVVFGHPEIREVLHLPSGDLLADGTCPPSLRLASDGIWIDGRKISADEFRRQAMAPEGTPVRVQPGMVLRNGTPLAEDFVAEDPEYRVPEFRVPAHTCFVLGDNRNQSHDSHRWGPLDMRRIVGRADAVFWPLARVHRIE